MVARCNPESGANIPTDEFLKRSLKNEPASDTLVRNLFRLTITADETCRGAGLFSVSPPRKSRSADGILYVAPLYLQCADQLFWSRWRDLDRPILSLCSANKPTRAIVLPKIHVPQAGATLNNLSRHLALCDAGADVSPVWRWIPTTYQLKGERTGFNLLVIPGPFKLDPLCFVEDFPAPSDPKRFGYFHTRQCQRAGA